MSQVFIVIVNSNGDAVLEKLRTAVADPHDIFKIDKDKFAVAYSGTSRDLSEVAGIRSEPSIASGIVFPITTYSGRADPALWEWLVNKMD